MKYQNIREEELKNKVAQDYFWIYDCTKIIGNVDFCVSMYQKPTSIFEQESLLWAEAKKGSSDIYKSIVQLILTIGKARTFDKYLPPAFLGAFDSEKIAFVPYNEIHDVFYLNDFNWNVTPSNYDTKEFQLIHEKVKAVIDNKALLFHFKDDDRELIQFIKNNFVAGKFGITKTKIDKNNFIVIYNKWLQTVKPTIAVNWSVAQKNEIIDGDFYLADLLSSDNVTLKDKLFVVLKATKYELNRHLDEWGAFTSSSVEFNDGQKAHHQFWNKYERPPKEEYWDYIVERRDLLVPQDVRERKGSFFTPQRWVELSQKYLTDVLGEDWQDEYYVWDCAAGTGNLLAGLTNKYNIWASTLDKQDVEVMHDRIKNGANLLDDHVFQFDFLNDDFTPKSKGGKLPDTLYRIIADEKESKKLVIYINPPYAEATTARTVTGTGVNKAGVAIKNKANQFFKNKIGNASNEIFALFMAQIYEKVPNSIVAQFSKLKFIQGSNFVKFKEFFKAESLGGFVVPANTFDNVKGKFPIGFTIWNLSQKKKISQISCDVFDKNAEYIGKKTFYGNLPESINKWIKLFDDKMHNGIGYMGNPSPDFQHNSQLYISINKGIEHFNFWNFTKNNISQGCIYFSVRHCIEATWHNDRDQFLYPNKGWKTDKEFQNDCLAFTLFHGQNRISSKEGINHWIPFTEAEVNARDKFDSHFMSDFLKGKMDDDQPENLFTVNEPKARFIVPLKFSPEAQAVFNAGKELWSYYHTKSNVDVNASLYDIKAYFQGRNEIGKMNNKSADETYMQLIGELREKLRQLAEKIETKVYEYEFLKS
jgi:predicted nuclease of restriction endonuclease-like (RecB) superfamily